MRRAIVGAAFALFLLVDVQAGRAQNLKLLDTKGVGTLRGKVTLDGKIPEMIDLTAKMKAHTDKACCLDPNAKAIDKIDQTWIVDSTTKAVANVVIWVRPPDGTYFEIPAKFKTRKDKVVIDMPFCAFRPRVSVYNPFYYDGKELVATGQELIVKNSSTVNHFVRAIGDQRINAGFNVNLPPKTELNVIKDLAPDSTLRPELLPVSLLSSFHRWMEARVYVFDHPYYAITDAKGNFEIKNVPAGAQIFLMAHHEGVGWLTTKEGEWKKGRAIMLKAGETTTVDLEVVAPR